MLKWIDAEETPPLDGQYCWVFNGSIGCQKARYKEGELGNRWPPNGSLITHWMPREPDPDEEETD